MEWDWDEVLDGQIRSFDDTDFGEEGSRDDFLRQVVIEAVVVRRLEFRCVIEENGCLIIKAAGKYGPAAKYF